MNKKGSFMKVNKILTACLLLQMNSFMAQISHVDWLRQSYSQCLKDKKGFNAFYNKKRIRLDFETLARDISIYKSKIKEKDAFCFLDSTIFGSIATGLAVKARALPRDVVRKPILAMLSASCFVQCLLSLSFLATYNLTHDDAALDSLLEAIELEIKDLKQSDLILNLGIRK